MRVAAALGTVEPGGQPQGFVEVMGGAEPVSVLYIRATQVQDRVELTFCIINTACQFAGCLITANRG